MTRKVDHNALRTHQAFLITFLIAAFIIPAPVLVAFIATVMLSGAIYPPARLFVLIYDRVLKPAGIVKPDVITDNPEPHRFAMFVGGLFTLASTLALIANLTVLGWVLSWIVIVLAALNLFVGFCAGCFVYYQLNRLGVPGFEHAPVNL